MKFFGRVRPKALRICILIAVASICFASALAHFSGLRVNTSRSLPIGLYLATNNARSELIEFCPNGIYAEQSKIRGYRSTGSCPDGGAPLIKPVVAREGDVVEMSAHGISVNGKLLRNTAPLGLDGRGRPLTSWRFGIYSVSPGEVWVASTYNYGSYDSRYFGPIPISSIRSRLRPIWTLYHQ